MCIRDRYYVGANGTRVTNTVKDGYYLNARGKNVIKVFNGDYIFVGDSRMVGMQSAVAPSDTLYIAKSGQEMCIRDSCPPALCTELEDNQRIRLLKEGSVKAGEPLFEIEVLA